MFSPLCLQPDADALAMSEDCLYLNVSRPPGTRRDARLPVMVHLHPGGNYTGGARAETAPFVREGVIVVTLNYRLNLFGFFAHPALRREAASSAMYGILDQIAALRWVQANIAAFGGDPRAVTLFGFSAGADDALVLLASPLAQGLFARVALQTITRDALYGLPADRETLERGGDAFAKRFGCADIDCLRQRPADVLLAHRDDWPLGPTIDGQVLPRSPFELLHDGYGRVPLLLGSNRDERAWDLIAAREAGPLRAERYAEVLAPFIVPSRLDQAKSCFEPAALGSIEWAVVALVSAAEHTCPVGTVADLAERPTYRYFFTCGIERAEMAASAHHGVDDTLLWDDPWAPLSRAEQTLGAQMRRYWTNFAKSGDPNRPDDAALIHWPRYDGPRAEVLILDLPTQVHAGGVLREACEVLSAFPRREACALSCGGEPTSSRLPPWAPGKW
jgi:para-nitrobenzyl esterase